eukprot:CAMPEP_0173429550 /NCGR_PEP_ID=MMETSP1357-20121228/8225_1 /TAXON_ID=77926 /ORGANISM="Hemiselmis rufescens, Strain PCC563" /LENGTH=70 /DNA_ID=CAMNT_0014393749 /DNA_START=377 /DNA_END=589 /DNA_ORIENTATION=+
MNVRNFVIGKDGDWNVAEKVYCQGSCQTLRAVKRKDEQGRVVVGISNVEHHQCGEQLFSCKGGDCLSASA